MELREFLQIVVTSDKGYLNICHSAADGSDWTEEFYDFPTKLDDIVERVGNLRNRNVYFSPYLFRDRSSKKGSAIVGRTIAADLDGANVLTLQYRPTVLVESSPGRHQGYWILDEPIEDHEKASKQLTYSIPGCDKSGWWVAHKFRVPTTSNYKWPEPATVTLVAHSGRKLKLIEIMGLPDVPSKNGTDYDISNDAITRALGVSSGPQEFLASIQHKLPPKVVSQYNIESRDRSTALWALSLSGFRAGLSTDQVFFLARGSANNKFTGLRFNGDRELLKDVLRARQEAYGAHSGVDLKEKINTIRKFEGVAYEKLAFMAKTVIEAMKTRGQFINCADGTAWYIDNEIGKPIPIVVRAESLQVFLDHTFGINSTERESNYIIGSLIAHVNSLPAVGRLGSLSSYDRDSNVLLLHTGRKKILFISDKDVSVVNNGYDGIVFPWSSDQEIIDPFFKHSSTKWDDILFNNALNNIVGLHPKEAQALLKVWLIMLLLRNTVVARPILAVFGQPGSGKSTLFRRIYTLIYGRMRSLSSVTTAENFDFATAADPLVVFDNVDTWEKWLPDRLALAAAVSEVKRRKLYTNNETVTLTRQAFIGVTAHDPKFKREDVVDRFILLNLERLTEFRSETDIIDYIHDNRSELWGAIIEDIQKVLRTPIPTNGYPQFRIEDFAKFGYWIATAVGCHDTFIAAIEKVAADQKATNLESDQTLVDALVKYTTRDKYDPTMRTPSQWWGILPSMSRDPMDFERTYKNAVTLGKKFWTIQNSLKTMFEIEWSYDGRRGTRLWSFKIREEYRNGIS